MLGGKGVFCPTPLLWAQGPGLFSQRVMLAEAMGPFLQGVPLLASGIESQTGGLPFPFRDGAPGAEGGAHSRSS